MTPATLDDFLATVADTPLAGRLPSALAPLLEARAEEASLAALGQPLRRGIARAVASQPETGVFLGHRPALLERLAAAGPDTLALRARELDTWAPPDDSADLEASLDALRLLRREDTCLAACLQHAGLVDFAEVSRFLSILAETIVRCALELAESRASGAVAPLAVIGMGKIAGREFTYHSDLDLLFLYHGGPEVVDGASRVGQRLISYLQTMTGAGVAYAVDTRLRPSGRQGMLVTSLDAFERYQCEKAETWEHVAMLRARALAGAAAPAEAALRRVRERVLSGHPPPWQNLVEIRRRVEQERAAGATQGIPLKTGAGGLMDVDFLAGGGLLERRLDGPPPLPSVPAMLRAAVRGPRVDALLEEYDFLRRVEADARWMAGRPVEAIAAEGEPAAALAELVRPGLGVAELLERVETARSRIRDAYQRVITTGTISALGT